ncbi:MAG: hypothetical protein A2Y62_05320 [Candidatus Fischerbacteria bacterium RBG_13_37_8]|uniref:Peptidase S26 domain-containing protein n=1 Tax=Candidatus Fischerbacteria bacterium RBG_13_37_8 TaxID=1817863 RepID=A0A1F5VXX8_9BACT|nr:MAG: hypothetical protein A2Y62_05320 [Candidatus Fischerbacteria bacterium RBG_13_37_8]
MECKRCKTENPPGLEVCFNCGSKLGNEGITIKPPVLKSASIQDSYTRAKRPGPSFISNNFISRFFFRILSFLIERNYLILAALFIISYIPSAGLFINGKFLKALIYLIAILLLVFITVETIYYTISNVFLFAIGLLCIYSCYISMIAYLSKRNPSGVEGRIRIGMALLSSSVFILVIALVFTGYYSIVYPFGDQMEPYIKRTDRFLIDYSYGGAEGLKRDDIILIRTTLGIILAFPGDTVTYKDRKLYINNELDKHGELMAGLFGMTGGYVLESNEYLVLMAYIMAYRREGGRKVIEIINGNQIEARAIAIINPPARRKLL